MAWSSRFSVLSSQFSETPALRSTLLRTENCLLRQFVTREKKAQLEASRFIRIGAVNGVLLDVGCPFLADGALFSSSRVGGAHQFAQIGDGVFLFQRQRYDRPTGHEP